MKGEGESCKDGEFKPDRLKSGAVFDLGSAGG